MTNVEGTTAEQTAVVAPQGAQEAPEKATTKKKASQKKNGPKAKKGAKKTAPKKSAKNPDKQAPKPKASGRAAVPREFSKKEIILDLLRRKGGATLAEIMEATSWQAHSVRGFISGTLGKTMGLVVVSSKREDGTRVYSLAK